MIMFWDIFSSVLFLLTGIGVLLVGVIKLSNVLQSGSSERIASMFVKMGNNRLVGFGVGTAATTVIQSSTATTVIVVSLVNAGIVTFAQSTAIIFGANVGTAVSSILLSLSALPIKYVFMSLVFFGAFIKFFSKKEKIRLNKAADIMISFGTVFVGLEIMSLAFSDALNGGYYLTNAFSSILESVTFPLLLIIIGFLLTAIIQSSTAAIGIFIALAANNVLFFNSIMYLVIGTLLGTTLTTLIASIPANKNAKRTALTHLLFAVMATLLFLPILWPLESIFVPAFEYLIPDPVWQVSVFSLIIKLATAIILLPLIKPMNKLIFLVIRDKPLTEEQQQEAEAEEAELAKKQQDSFQGFTDQF